MKKGEVYKTLNFGELEIIEYINAQKVAFRFLDTGFEGFAESGQIKKGQVKDYLYPSVFGVGFMGCRKYKSTSKEYCLWFRMLRSCYSKMELMRNPCYSNCEVSQDFRSLSYFGDWCNKQIGFGKENFALDKDLLGSRTVKKYSPQNCIFLPNEINTAIADMVGLNCGCAGVSITSYGAYQVKVSGKYCGVYKTLQEAKDVYLKVKKSRLVSLAEKWKDEIDPRSYEALLNFQVFI